MPEPRRAKGKFLLKTQMNKPRVAMIPGVAGKDSAYQAEKLLDNGYEMLGIKRQASLLNDHLYKGPHVEHQRFALHCGDFTGSIYLIRIIQQVQSDEICKLAAMNHIALSFETLENGNGDKIGTLRFLEAVGVLGLKKKTRLCQASPIELYGLQQIQQAAATLVYCASPTRSPSSTSTGSMSTTARHTARTPATATSSTIKARFTARPPARARTRARSRVSRWACRTACTWAISPHFATAGNAEPRQTDPAVALARRCRRPLVR
jgi:hypothetical protein